MIYFIALRFCIWCLFICSPLIQVEALAVKLTQKEGELIQEKFEVKKLVNFLKQVMQLVKLLLTYILQ